MRPSTQAPQSPVGAEDQAGGGQGTLEQLASALPVFLEGLRWLALEPVGVGFGSAACSLSRSPVRWTGPCSSISLFIRAVNSLCIVFRLLDYFVFV